MENKAINLEEIISKGAVIIDVRTKEEFDAGHIHGSFNIPVSELSKNLNWLVKDVPIVVCCASGARSETAKFILQANNFKEVYNGGAWDDLGNLKGIGSCKVK
jgi:rhodanese-related sulfurtransferase